MIKKITAVLITFCMIFCFTACGNDKFEKKGDYLTGNDWKSTDGQLLDLRTDGTYKLYKTSTDLNNNYYTGTFEVKKDRKIPL